MGHAHTGHGGNALLHIVPVAFQVPEQGLFPVAALVVGDQKCFHGYHVGHRRQTGNVGLILLAQRRIGDDGKGHGQGRNVVGLGSAGQGDGMLARPVIRQEIRGVHMVVKHKLTVDLVRDHGQAVLLAEGGELVQLFFAEHPAHRVVGTAQDEGGHAGRGGNGFFHRVQVHLVAACGVLPQGHFQPGKLCFCRQPADVRIHGCVVHDGTAQHPAGHVCTGHHSGHKHDPFPGQVKPVQALVVGDHAIVVFIAQDGVAVHRVLHPAGHRIHHFLRGGQVHVRHPHGDVVPALIVPFAAAGALAGRAGFKIKHDDPSPNMYEWFSGS